MPHAGALIVLLVAGAACSLLLNDDYTTNPGRDVAGEGGVEVPPPDGTDLPVDSDGSGGDRSPTEAGGGDAPDAEGDADADASANLDADAGADAGAEADAGADADVDAGLLDAGTPRSAFVAVGDDGRRAVSTDDGLTWTLVGGGDAGAAKLNSVAFGNDRFVAVGTMYTPAFHAASTTDFKTWKWTDTLVGNVGGRYQVAFGAGRFVAVRHGSTSVSDNGVDWATYDVDFDFQGLTFGNDKFVAAGARRGVAAVATSADGISWTPTTIGGATLTDIAYGNGRFVGVGDKGRRGTSLDGTSWTFHPGTSSQLFFGVVFGKGLFVANDGRTTSDGLSWTAPILRDGATAYGGGTFVHFSFAEKAVYRSTNGTSWGKPVQTFPWRVESVAYGEW